MSKHIYLLLTRSNTFVSKAIYQVTKAEYTHISLSIDDKIDTMYSFCRRYPDLPLPAGFTTESIYRGFYKKHHNIPCRLYRLEISDNKYEALKMSLEDLMTKSKQLKYDVLGTMLCTFEIEHERHNHRYCSWFVAEILGNLNILEFDKHYSLVHPMDFAKFDDLQLIYTGNVGELASTLQIKNIYNLQ